MNDKKWWKKEWLELGYIFKFILNIFIFILELKCVMEYSLIFIDNLFMIYNNNINIWMEINLVVEIVISSVL